MILNGKAPSHTSLPGSQFFSQQQKQVPVFLSILLEIVKSYSSILLYILHIFIFKKINTGILCYQYTAPCLPAPTPHLNSQSLFTQFIHSTCINLYGALCQIETLFSTPHGRVIHPAFCHVTFEALSPKKVKYTSLLTLDLITSFSLNSGLQTQVTMCQARQRL